MATTGPAPMPIERKRALGNPRQHSLPDKPDVALEPAESIPEPPRPLGNVGREFWDSVWGGAAVRWLSPESDLWHVQLVAEMFDERAALRYRVLSEGDAGDRRALRQLESLLFPALGQMGFNPGERTRMGLAEVRARATVATLANYLGADER